MAADVSSYEEAAERAEKPELKLAYANQAQGSKQELSKIAPLLVQAQSREAELSQMLNAEEARWTDLIGKLEQSVRK